VNKIKDETQVKTASPEEVAELFDIDTNVMLPGEEPKKPNIFSQVGPDTTFLDKPDDNPPADPPADPPIDPAIDPPADPPADPPTNPDDILAPPSDDTPPANLVDNKNKGGRPTSMIAAAKKLIENKVLLPFDDGKKIEEYTAADWEELITENFNNVQSTMQEQLPQQFFQNMPTEMQQAYQYFANGGQDVKALFTAMGQSAEIRELNIEDEPGQILAVRSYLQATGYGTPEEIEEEIVSLQDRGDLEKKAGQFKPKLDAMQQNMVNQRLAHQEQQNRQRQQQSQAYQENIYEVLKKGEVNGIKLDERTQNLIYAGLVQPNYQSVSGKQTNLLGHLLEKYQWVEPNHELISEVLWHLADPEGYREELRKGGAIAATEKVVRKLKTEAANKHASSSAPEVADNTGGIKRSAIQRPKRNFFARG